MNRKKIIAFLIAVALVAALMWLPECGNDANPDNRAASDRNSGSVNEYVTGNEDGDSSEENIYVDELSQVHEYPLVSGHRGANDIAPENTMASADSCIKYGIEIMETDVKISSDSVFYVLHDWKLDRTTNGSGYLYERPSSYIDKLDAGAWFGKDWTGQKVPRFKDLLRKAKKGGLMITIDYKDGDIEKLVDLVKSEGMLDRTFFTFSKEAAAIDFRARYPHIRTLQAYLRNADELDHVIEVMDPDVVATNIKHINKKFVEECHSRNIKVLALILGLENKSKLNRKALEYGVDIVATDRPKACKQQYIQSEFLTTSLKTRK